MPPLYPPKEQTTLYAHTRGQPKTLAKETASVGDCVKKRSPVLNFSEMDLKELPPGMESCDACTEVNLNENLLDHLPPGCLPPHTSTLRLTGNHFASVPDALAELPELSRLYLGANLLTEAEAVLRLPHLVHASLNNNRITSLAAGMTQSTILSLDLSGNDIIDLSHLLYELKQLPRLKALCLAGNPFCLGEGYRRKVLDVLPDLAYLDGEKLEEEDETDGSRCGDASPMMFMDASADTFDIEIELKSLKVKDPNPPVPKHPPPLPIPEKKLKQGVVDEGPTAPPLVYFVVFDAPGKPGIHTLPVKHEVELPEQTSRTTSPNGGKKPKTPPKGEKPTEKKPPAAGDADGSPKLPRGWAKITLTLPSSLEVRNWLRDGIELKLYRTEMQPQPEPVVPEAEEDAKEVPEPYVAYEPDTHLLARGKVAPLALLDGQTMTDAQSVSCKPEPLLWDHDGYRRLALDDPRQPLGKVATLKAKFLMHPPKPEPPAEEDLGGTQGTARGSGRGSRVPSGK